MLPLPVSDEALTAPYVDISAYLPPLEQIPDTFQRLPDPFANPYTRWQFRWFTGEVSVEDFPEPRGEIDGEVAYRHLWLIQKAPFVDPVHKMAAVAYLMSMWFEEPA